jgi:hypothetical protein
MVHMTGAVQRMLLTACLAALLPSAVGAQWLNYPAAGVPRLADGKPDLNAPAPRAADGRPDLSGIWYMRLPGTGDPAAVAPSADYTASPEFFNIGVSLPGGLPYQPWAATLVKARVEQFAKDDPIGMCKPIGAVRLLTLPPPRKFVQLPHLFLILSERDVTYRQVFLDQRPALTDPEPAWNGYSTGRWEGDTLVVQTIGFRDDTWLDRNGSPMTSAARITERFRRVNYGRVEIELTVDDPKAYTRPWTVRLTQVLAPDTELLDYHCMDNEKDASRLVGK